MTSRIALALTLSISTPVYAAIPTSSKTLSLADCKLELRDAILGYEYVLQRTDQRRQLETRLLRIRIEEQEQMLLARTPTVAAALVPMPDPMPAEGYDSGDQFWVGLGVGAGGVVMLGAIAAVALAVGGVFK